MGLPRVVLVVEDDHATRSRLTTYVADAIGVPVVGARSGAEALARAEAQRPDVVFVDLTMPRGEGSETARALRRGPAGRGAWIVGMTPSYDPRLAFDCGCDEVLAVPFDLASVSRALRAGSARKDLVYCRVPAPRLAIGDTCPRCGHRVEDPNDHMRQAGRCVASSTRENLSGRR